MTTLLIIFIALLIAGVVVFGIGAYLDSHHQDGSAAYGMGALLIIAGVVVALIAAIKS